MGIELPPPNLFVISCVSYDELSVIQYGFEQKRVFRSGLSNTFVSNNRETRKFSRAFAAS
jgi:hypothetical protein